MSIKDAIERVRKRGPPYIGWDRGWGNACDALDEEIEKESPSKLSELRDALSWTDLILMDVLTRRAQLVTRIQMLKATQHEHPIDVGQEARVINRAMGSGGYSDSTVEKVFRALFEGARDLLE